MENIERFKEKIPENERRREIKRTRNCPEFSVKCHIFEVEYWENYPDVWEMVPGTKKDLGPESEENKL